MPAARFLFCGHNFQFKDLFLDCIDRRKTYKQKRLLELFFFFKQFIHKQKVRHS